MGLPTATGASPVWPPPQQVVPQPVGLVPVAAVGFALPLDKQAQCWP
jgi:hypothetical protein